MPGVNISKVRLEGIACAVPQEVRTIEEEYAQHDSVNVEKICKNIGVRRRHIAARDQCTSDLCHAAADKLLNLLRWQAETIDLLILVTQTSDYVLPATSCVLQHRLGLSNNCACFDVNLGCSGYVYGLWLMGSLLATGRMRRGLLLAGDTISRLCSPNDRATMPLFGDAGTATALSVDDAASPMYFKLGTDGSGKDHLIVPAGGFRTPHSAGAARRKAREGGNVRSEEDLYMNGAEIFTFTLKRVPQLIADVLERSEWSPDDVDAFVMHQANSFILNHLGKKMKLPQEKVIIALEEFGNTSSASIPLALSARLRSELTRMQRNMVLAGFGVGYSWAAVSLTTGPLVMPDVICV